MDSQDWHQIIFSQPVFGRLEALCEQSLPYDSVEGLSYVINKLTENDFDRCRKYQARRNAKPETYIYSIANNLMVDFRREREGRPRPPKWLREKGQLWINLWKEVCLKRRKIQEVVNEYYYNEGFESKIVRQTITVIREKVPGCGMNPNPVDTYRDYHEGRETADNSQAPDEYLANQHREHGLMMLTMLINPDQNREFSLDPDMNKNLESIELSSEQRLLLQMYYADGLSYAAIAGKLGLKGHQVHRQIEHILKKLRELFPEL